MTHKRGSQLETWVRTKNVKWEAGVSPEFGASLVYRVSSTPPGYLKKKKRKNNDEDIWGELRGLRPSTHTMASLTQLKGKDADGKESKGMEKGPGK